MGTASQGRRRPSYSDGCVRYRQHWTMRACPPPPPPPSPPPPPPPPPPPRLVCPRTLPTPGTAAAAAVERENKDRGGAGGFMVAVNGLISAMARAAPPLSLPGSTERRRLGRRTRCSRLCMPACLPSRRSNEMPMFEEPRVKFEIHTCTPYREARLLLRRPVVAPF
jgi:hypothetical protein